MLEHMRGHHRVMEEGMARAIEAALRAEAAASRDQGI